MHRVSIEGLVIEKGSSLRLHGGSCEHLVLCCEQQVLFSKYQNGRFAS